MTKSQAQREAKRINRTYCLDAWSIPAKDGMDADGITRRYVVYVSPFRGAKGKDLIRVSGVGWTPLSSVAVA